MEPSVSSYSEDFGATSPRRRRFQAYREKSPRAVDDTQLNMRSARLTPKWMIDPRYSKFSQHWDLITMFALIFTAIVTPYEVPRAEPRFTCGSF